MMSNKISCSYADGIRWLQDHLLACPFKKLTGFDCPGCGFQRSVIALLQGNLSQSLHYYPATIPLLFALVFTFANKRLPFKKPEQVTQFLYVFTGVIIVGAYLLKMSNLYKL